MRALSVRSACVARNSSFAFDKSSRASASLRARCAALTANSAKPQVLTSTSTDMPPV